MPVPRDPSRFNASFTGSITTAVFETTPSLIETTSGTGTSTITWPDGNTLSYEFPASSAPFTNAMVTSRFRMGKLHVKPRPGWTAGLVPGALKATLKLTYVITSPISTTLLFRFDVTLESVNAGTVRESAFVRIRPSPWPVSTWISVGTGQYSPIFYNFVDTAQSLIPPNIRQVGTETFGVILNGNASVELDGGFTSIGVTNVQARTKVEGRVGRGIAGGVCRGMR